MSLHCPPSRPVPRQPVPSFQGVLLSTGARPIVEASPYDSVWGIGLAEAQARRCPANQWPGRNLLGKVLMALRAELLKPHGGPGVWAPSFVWCRFLGEETLAGEVGNLRK